MSNVAIAMKVPPHWLHYVTVADMDDTLARIKKSGGTVMNGPMDIPGDESSPSARTRKEPFSPRTRAAEDLTRSGSLAPPGRRALTS